MLWKYLILKEKFAELYNQIILLLRHLFPGLGNAKESSRNMAAIKNRIQIDCKPVHQDF